MTMKTLTKTTLILSSALALGACGGGGSDAPGSNASAGTGPQSLVYAYPGNHQTEVAPPAPIALRFSSAVTLADAQGAVTLHQGGAGGTAVGADMALAPDGKGVILDPTNDLKPHTQYTVVVHDLPLKDGTANDQNITFTTRALQHGPKNLVIESDDFELARHFPDGSRDQPVMDFSTFRLQFTQPIDATTAKYGEGPDDTVKLTDRDGDLVPATLIVSGPYMTVDPKPEYLSPGEKYTLTLNGQVASSYDTTLTDSIGNGGTDFSFTPKESSPRGAPSILVQHITDSHNGSKLSLLTGQPVNQVPVNGTLLGKDVNKTQAQADVRAELADATVYPNVLPIRIPKGTVLNGSSIDIKIGGHVDAGYDSGAVKMTLLSDATGYLEPNPYSNRPDALRIVHLFMDVGITTEDPRANGGFTQNLLHIELVGNSEVNSKAGVLNLDAVSVVQPDVLGLEYGYGTLSFQLQSYKDQGNAPKTVADTTAPKVQSWMPGPMGGTADFPDKGDMQRPNDPIVLNFDEPLDPQSLRGHVHLLKTENGNTTEQVIKAHIDGAALVIKPDEALEYNAPNATPPQAVSYEVKLDAGVTDLAGNQFAGLNDGTFQLPTLTERRTGTKHQTTGDTVDPEEDAATRAPYISGVYPGFPCVIGQPAAQTYTLNPSQQDLAHNIAGRCRGGMPNQQLGIFDSYGVKPDDLLPVMTLPANRPIVVTFSRNLDKNTIVLGDSFKVRKVTLDALGNIASTSEVPGQLEVRNRALRFYPNNSWNAGTLYQYILVSGVSGFGGTYTATCHPQNATASTPLGICDSQGRLIQTQIMPDKTQISSGDQVGFSPPDHSQPYNGLTITSDLTSEKAGGPNMIQYFRGALSSNNILQVLNTAPISDTNGNLVHDRNRHVDPATPEVYAANPFWGGYRDYNYLNQEYGPSSVPDPYTDASLDPDGVRPAPNSAKIISAFKALQEFENPFAAAPQNLTGAFYGANVGCGYTSFHPIAGTASKGICNSLNNGNECYGGTPSICPLEKFTYLSGTLFAEVTDNYEPGKGLRVNLWPGKISGTSFFTVLDNYAAPNFTTPSPTGPQLMRLRYQKDDPNCDSTIDICSRTQPITGWITSDKHGSPIFKADVQLYLDAVGLQDAVNDTVGVTLQHNLYSYKVDMALQGPIQFLNDGRMRIQQFNLHPIDITLKARIAIVKLRIPEKGAFLQYLSNPVERKFLPIKSAR